MSTLYPADLEEFLVAAPEELVGIDMLASNSDIEENCNLAKCTQGPDILVVEPASVSTIGAIEKRAARPVSLSLRQLQTHYFWMFLECQ